MAETLRHFAEGSHQQSEEFKRSEIGEDVQLYPVQIPQHEVQADQEGTWESSEKDDRFGTHRATVSWVLQDDGQADLLHAVQEVRQDHMRATEDKTGVECAEGQKRLYEEQTEEEEVLHEEEDESLQGEAKEKMFSKEEEKMLNLYIK